MQQQFDLQSITGYMANFDILTNADIRVLLSTLHSTQCCYRNLKFQVDS